jgi:hypothetical protein
MDRTLQENPLHDMETMQSRALGALVIGDWLVDEHWVVGKHRAPSSSRTGREHSRALHRECSVRSLCGAGQVATILHQATNREQRPFHVTGVGIWNTGDTATLTNMLDPAFNVGRTPHRLAYDELRLTKNDSRDATLITLVPREVAVNAGTTRVFRIYRHLADQLELEQRIDWELPLTDIDHEAIRKNLDVSLKGLRGPVPIQHIFVKDLGKGVVSSALVTWLKQTFGGAAWYVSSKVWRPSWFKDLPKNSVRLILIPQLAAQSAVNTGAISSSSWITSTGVPSEDALDAINQLQTTFGNARIIILPDGMNVLARDGDNAYVRQSPGPSEIQPFTPMASVFFPALAANLILRPQQELITALTESIAFTSVWEKAEAQRTMVDNWVPTADQILSLSDSPRSVETALWTASAWSSLMEEWKQAFSKLGVVACDDERGRRDEFQLWRAMTDLHGYVTCIPSKRRHVLTLLREGRSLRRALADERKNRSFFIVDTPGSGKSFLVDCLSSTLGMQSLKFNVTTLSNRLDLMECFQRISAVQSEHPGATLMVFFDEMNAKIANQHVYDAFLEPLEDGRYVYNGRTFYLRPCLWLFAATEVPSAAKNASTKWSDFESRLSAPVMALTGDRDSESRRLDAGRDVEELRSVEQVYIGVSTVHSVFPDVTKISTKVLEAFSLIDIDKVGPRGIRRFVRSFRYVQYGRVMEINLPENWAAQMGVVGRELVRWKEQRESEAQLVEIKSRLRG